MKTDTDYLLKRAKNGDSEAFCALMEAHTQDMYKVSIAILGNSEDAADAIQDTILACLESLHTLRKNRYFKTWLIRILINNCRDILSARQNIVYGEDFPEPPVSQEDFQTAEWKQLLAHVEEKYRMILLLYYMEDFNTREIAQILHMNENTVKSRLLRGRKIIAAEYKSETGRYPNECNA